MKLDSVYNFSTDGYECLLLWFMDAQPANQSTVPVLAVCSKSFDTPSLQSSLNETSEFLFMNSDLSLYNVQTTFGISIGTAALGFWSVDGWVTEGEAKINIKRKETGKVRIK